MPPSALFLLYRQFPSRNVILIFSFFVTVHGVFFLTDPPAACGTAQELAPTTNPKIASSPNEAISPLDAHQDRAFAPAAQEENGRNSGGGGKCLSINDLRGQ
jgi:hypothetical protein